VGRINLFSLAVSLLLLTGCVATREDVVGLEVQVTRLEKSLATLEKKQAELATSFAEIKRPVDSLNSNLLDTQSLLNNFNPRFEELKALLANLRKEGADRVIALEGHLDEKIKELKRTPLPAKTPAKVSKANVSSKTPKPSVTVETDDANNPTEIYHQAYKDFQAKRWALADAGFAQYLKGYPEGSYADECLFYSAITAKEQKDQVRALDFIEQLSKEYPKSPLVKSALLEKAKILVAQNKSKEAEGILELITLNYPDSKEATQAKELLGTLSAR